MLYHLLFALYPSFKIMNVVRYISSGRPWRL